MKLIILDRDGVINYDSPLYVKSPAEWLPLPGSLEAIALLKKANYQVAVATNQSGIGRGLYDLAMLEAIHQKMQDLAQAEGGKIDFIAYCPHLPDAGCACRKPRAGLLLQIAEHFQCSLDGVPVVGDRLSDVNAALAAEATPMMVETGLGSDAVQAPAGVPVYPRLLTLVEALLGL
jgi:D-glycero-D-manno-heptose 1,7-bisphosphate phosphatase